MAKRRTNKAMKAYRRKIRRGLRSGKYATVCSSFTKREICKKYVGSGKSRRCSRVRRAPHTEYRCRDKGSGRFVKGTYCKSARCK